MKSIKWVYILVFTLVLTAFSTIYSQSKEPTATVGTFVGTCEMKVGDGDWGPLKFGDEVPANADIRVSGKNDFMELRMPDGSLVNILGMTSIRVGDLMKPTEQGKKKSFISLLVGKLFAKIKPGSDQDFRVETETAFAAVRGTKFGVTYSPGEGGNVVVSEGSVAVGDPMGKFEPVMLKKGFMSTLPGQAGLPMSPPKAAPLELIKEFDEDYKEEPKKEEPKKEKKIDEPKKEDKPKDTAPIQPTTPPMKAAECSEQGMNWSVSTENINSLFWNKVLLSPTVKLGDLSFGLYLTLYFQSMDDVFTPNKWYNYNEWDFTNWSDALHDVLLKIRFVQYQNQFMLFKLGNIPDFTIGHGTLVGGYANDLQFPAIRKVGAQLNMDFGRGGFETMVGDAFQANLFAGRAFFRPLFGTPVFGDLGVGASGFIDIDPLQDGKHKVFGYAADLDLPISKLELFSITLYSDLASQGYFDELLGKTNSMIGYGLFAGVKGTIVIIDYKAEYRRLSGGFVPNYVDRFYDVKRSINYNKLFTQSLLADQALNYNGFMLEAGKSFEGVGGVTLRYEHLFPETVSTNTANTLHIEARISKCLFKKAYGVIAYDRQNFNFGDLFSNFLGNGSVVTTQVFYQMTEGAYVGITYKNYYQQDANGVLSSKTTYGLETQIGL